MICSIYARVSDESQLKGDSIEHQISFCRAFARRRSLEEGQPWTTPDALVYVDAGISGTSMVKRLAVQNLIRDARDGKFHIVLFKGISRFARDTVDALLMLRTLVGSGVRVISMEENFDSKRDRAEFVFTIHSALAQAESEKTAIRVRMGVLEKAKAGKWNGAPPYGYILNRTTKRLEVDEATAHVVRHIFGLYLQGYGCRRIVDILHEQGLYTKSGAYWSHRNISRMLRNPVYVGDVVYGRKEKSLRIPDETDLLTRKKRNVRVADENEIVVCRDAHAGIIHRDTFCSVREIMEKRRTQAGRTGRVHLLTKGILKCTCGCSMTIRYNGHGTAYYRCIGRMNKGDAFCDRRYIRAEAIEAAVLHRLRADLRDVMTFEAITSPPLQSAGEIQKQIRAVDQQIERQMEHSQKLFDKFAEGELLDEQYTRMNETLRTRIQSLQRTHEHLMAEKDNLWNEVDWEKAFRTTVGNALHVNTRDPMLTRKILELLVKEVTISRVRDKCIDVTISYHFTAPGAVSSTVPTSAPV